MKERFITPFLREEENDTKPLSLKNTCIISHLGTLVKSLKGIFKKFF